jgi:hypothetical protein
MKMDPAVIVQDFGPKKIDFNSAFPQRRPYGFSSGQIWFAASVLLTMTWYFSTRANKEENQFRVQRSRSVQMHRRIAYILYNKHAYTHGKEIRHRQVVDFAGPGSDIYQLVALADHEKKRRAVEVYRTVEAAVAGHGFSITEDTSSENQIPLAEITALKVLYQ